MRGLTVAMLVAAAAGLAGCDTYDDGYGRPRYPYQDGYGAPGPVAAYEGGSYGAPGVGGTGAKYLDPWLAGTPEGQALVLARFDHNHNGEIGEDRAGEANRWFRRFADRNHDLLLTDREIRWGLARIGRELGR